MKKERIDFSSKIILLWALINVAMMPLAFAAPENNEISDTFHQESISTTTFSKVTPLESDDHRNIVHTDNIGPAKIFFALMCFMMIACLGLSYKMRMSRKGQITVFIIIILVLGVIFGFMFYLRNQTSGKSLEQEREKIFTDFMEASGFKVYMQNCIDKISADGIELLGMQGGYLYYSYPNDNIRFIYKPSFSVNSPQITSRNPWHDPDLNDPYNGPTVNIWGIYTYTTNFFGEYAVPYIHRTPTFEYTPTLQYSIKQNQPITDKPVSLYPYNDFNSTLKSPLGYDDLRDVLGTTSNYLSPLCNDYSKFKDGAAMKKYFTDRGIIYQCETYRSVALGYPMDMKLADFVRGHIDECYSEWVTNVNTSGSNLFEELTMLDITINSTAIQTYSVIGDNDVTIFVDMPMKIKMREDTTFEKTIEFSSRKDIRLRYAYDLAEAIINRESRDIFFSLSAGEINTRLGKVCREYFENDTVMERRRLQVECVKENMDVEVFRDIDEPFCDSPGISFDIAPSNTIRHCKSASVVRILDNDSLVNDYPFSFLFAIENRAPALNYIDRKTMDTTNSTLLYDPLSYQYMGLYTLYPTYIYLDSNLGNIGSQYINDSGYTDRDFRKHIMVMAGDPVRIFPFAIDPDDPANNVSDNNIIYTYEGWKSNRSINITSGNLSFDIDPANDLPLQTIGLYEDPYPSILNATEPYSPTNINEWEESEYYKGNYSYTGLEVSSWADLEAIKTDLMPYGFTNVGKHNFIHKDGYYLTNPADTGYHWVRVYARDKDEPDVLFDYQDVLIQVRCMPATHPCCDPNLDYHFNEDMNKTNTCCYSPNHCTPYGCVLDSTGDITYDNEEGSGGVCS